MGRTTLALAGLALLMAACGGASPADPGSGERASFKFTTFEGDEFSAAERRGTPVVLNFWESW